MVSGVLLLGLVACTGAGRASDPAAVATTVTVWSGEDPDFLTGDISPDGRYLSDIDWASGDLQVTDLQSGQVRNLTGQGYDAGGYAWMSAFSSDSRRVAVAWYLDSVNSHELRVVNLDGTGSRVVVPAGEGHYYVDPVDWSRSDEEILVAVQVADRTWRLDLVALDNGARRTVKIFGWQTPGGGHDQAYPDADLSPDGRYVAYDYPSGPTGETRDIYSVAVDGGQETTLVSGPGSDRLLGWLPDGTGILFYSDRSGTASVWRLRVEGGRASGEPELVQDGLPGLIPLGFTPAGYAYGASTETEQVHTAELDSDGRTAQAPRPVSGPPWRKSMAADWSPDGSRLAYITHDPLPNPVENLVIASMDGAITRTLPLTPALHTSNGSFRWTTEHQVFFFAYEKGRDGIYEVDLRSGSFRRLATPASVGRGGIKWFEVGPDGRTLYLIGAPADGGRENALLAFDAVTGQHRVLGRARAIRATLAVSPDGTELAYLMRDDASRQLELRVTPSSGTGNARTLHRRPRGSMVPPVAWTPDGSRLVFALQADGDSSGLWSIPVQGGEPVQLLANCCREHEVRIHREGRRLAFAAGRDRGEVRILKGY